MNIHKILKSIIAFSLKHRFFTFFWVGLVALAGAYSFIKIPVEAFPDVTNTQVILVSQWQGRSAEEVERFVTTPLEIAMNGVQRKTSIRSVTMFGLSVVKIIFEDEVDDLYARQQVSQLLANVHLPDGVVAEMQPPYGPTGEIFRYTLASRTKDSRELLTIQNWVIDRQLRAVKGVADVVAFGGQEKIYEVALDPDRLHHYGLTAIDLYESISQSNRNVGGDVLEKNGQAYVVRGLGLLQTREDLENTVVDQHNGAPVQVKHLGEVRVSSMPRVGQVGLNEQDDVVEGIVVMRKGENPSEVLKKVKAKVDELNQRLKSEDVRLVTFYDRDTLMDYFTRTVLGNLAEGIVLVTVVVFLFMSDWRTTLIVGIVIPLSLLFAFLLLYSRGMSANLLSLGAIDFGIIIDGAVVMVEGIFAALDQRARRMGMTAFNKLSKLGLIRESGSRTGKAVFFSKLIIISALIPLFSFERVEGKMFSPLAYTLGFALIGALIFTITLVPLLSAILLRRDVKEKNNGFTRNVNRAVLHLFERAYDNKRFTLGFALIFFLVSLFSVRWMGTEFLPQLDEGALWVGAQLPMSYSLEESVSMVSRLRRTLMSFDEVDEVLSQTGRSNDGTDPNGFYFVQMQVNLKPKSEWKRKRSTEALISDMDRRLKEYQGIVFNYSQPIVDNVAEAVAGMKANNAIKIYGDDLHQLEIYAERVAAAIREVPGVKDVGVLKNMGQPELSLDLEEESLARLGVSKEDALSVMEMSIGGITATEIFDGDRRVPVRVRYARDYRSDVRDLFDLRVPGIQGEAIPIKAVAKLQSVTSPAFIYRDDMQRYIGIKFSIRERDLGTTIADAQRKVEAEVQLPAGYSMSWVGEFENQIRATQRLVQVVPLSLLMIFLLLFMMFGNAVDAGYVLLNVPFALTGGILAIHLTGIHFGISAGVGFIALFGICAQNGVLLITEMNQQIERNSDLGVVLKEAIRVRTRPVVMTALMAAIGLVPAAVSTGIGSEAQKPLAIVIIGGLVTATIFTLLVFPLVYKWRLKKLHQRIHHLN